MQPISVKIIALVATLLAGVSPALANAGQDTVCIHQPIPSPVFVVS